MSVIQFTQDKKKGIKYLFAGFTVLFVLLWAFALYPATPPDNSAGNHILEDTPDIEVIETTLHSLGQSIENILEITPKQLANELGVTPDRIEEKVTALKLLFTAYTGLKNAIIDLEKVKKEYQTTQQIYEDYRTKGMTKKPPYSLTFYDSIQAEISTASIHKQNILFTRGILEKNIEENKTRLTQKESELRQIREKFGKPGSPMTPQQTLTLEILELSVQRLKILRQTLGREKGRYEIENSVVDIHLKRLNEQGSFVGRNIHHDAQDLEHQLELIQKKEIEIQDEITKFKSDQTIIEQEWAKARQEMNDAATEQERTIAQAYLRARDEWRKTYMIVLELKQDSLTLLERQKSIWRERYAIVKGELSYDRQKIIYDEVEKSLSSLNQTLQIQQNSLITLQKQISAIDGLLQEEGTPLPVMKHLDVERDALKRQFERRLEFQSMLIATDQIEQNLLAQIKKQVNQPSVKDQFSGFILAINKIWNLEIWVVDQNSVSVGKIFTALIILVVGILSARFMVHLIHKRILAVSQFKETTASAVHKALSYFAYLMVFLLVLRIVNIPLTAFAFLGGAIAIGVGFGAQNLINNFISGFIILGERPIQIGDLIEVDGVLGKVEEIGARCTRVRTGENIHKLIPNSSFLEKNITNWTLSDNKIRTKVVVGVAYGSSVEKVEKALMNAVKSNKKVLKSPEPFVLFSDFGDNALIFEVYFWVMVRMVLEKKLIESKVRFEIDALFRKEDLVIAFPQRDLHFDSQTPLSIQFIDKAAMSTKENE